MPLRKLNDTDMAKMGPMMGEMSMLATMVGAEFMDSPTAASTADMTLQPIEFVVLSCHCT